jgi:hypothetical protein
MDKRMVLTIMHNGQYISEIFPKPWATATMTEAADSIFEWLS